MSHAKKPQNSGSDDIIIKTERRELVRIPVFRHELDSIGQMNRMQSVSLNIMYTAIGGALGSGPGAFGSNEATKASEISANIFWVCVAVGAIAGIFALVSWLANRDTKGKIFGSK